MTDTTIRAAHRTFRGPGGVGAPNLAGLPGVHRTRPGPDGIVEIQRYDTDDRRLAAAGITLARHRPEEGEPSWRLDLPDDDGGLRMPVTDAAAIPAELAELVRGAAREREVRPAAQARTVRTRTELLGDARVLATVVHDEVALATLGRTTEIESWAEIDLQPGDGDDALLAAITGRIAELGMRPGAPGAEAELDRLLRPRRRRLRAGKKGSAGAALVAYVGRHADRLAAEDLRVRRGQPDAVHQMRVASRRLRSALRASRNLLDRERVDPLVVGLRDLGRALAPARDAEVLRERIDADLAALPPELLLGPVRAQATRHFARVEAEAGAAVLTALDGPEYADVRRRLDELLERPPLTKRAGSRTAAPRSTARRLRRALDRALATGDDHDLHQARKAAKRLRYAHEVAGRTPRALKGLQKALGEHQDAVVTRGALRELGAAADNGFSFGLLHGQAQARAERVRADLPGRAEKARKALR